VAKYFFIVVVNEVICFTKRIDLSRYKFLFIYPFFFMLYNVWYYYKIFNYKAFCLFSWLLVKLNFWAFLFAIYFANLMLKCMLFGLFFALFLSFLSTSTEPVITILFLFLNIEDALRLYLCGKRRMSVENETAYILRLMRNVLMRKCERTTFWVCIF